MKIFLTVLGTMLACATAIQADNMTEFSVIPDGDGGYTQIGIGANSDEQPISIDIGSGVIAQDYIGPVNQNSNYAGSNSNPNPCANDFASCSSNWFDFSNKVVDDGPGPVPTVCSDVPNFEQLSFTVTALSGHVINSMWVTLSMDPSASDYTQRLITHYPPDLSLVTTPFENAGGATTHDYPALTDFKMNDPALCAADSPLYLKAWANEGAHMEFALLGYPCFCPGME